MPMLPLQSIFILNTRNASLWISFRKKKKANLGNKLTVQDTYSSLQGSYSLLIQKDILTFKLTALLFHSLIQSGNHFKWSMKKAHADDRKQVLETLLYEV